MSQKSQNKLIIGAAVAAGMLSTLASILAPKHHKNLSEQAHDLASNLYEKKDVVNTNLLIGTVAGGVIGVTAALLLAPKAGSELIEDLYHPFQKARKEVKSKSKDVSKKASKVKHDVVKKVKEKKKAVKAKASSVKKKVKKAVKNAADATSDALSE